jgi:Plasmid pRiA4b ORF-3-like protein
MPATRIYRLKVTLAGVRPPVWRRLETPAGVTLAQLHEILQVAMGWTNSHLHQFEQHGVLYGQSDRELGLERVSETRTTLAEVLRKPKDAIDYEYDFGDGWQHRIVLESVGEAGAWQAPRVLAGKGACPPEDVGGIYGYATFREAMANPRHPEHGEYREWYGRPFDPAAFDAEEVNADLAALRLRPARRTSKPAAGKRPMRRRRGWEWVLEPPAPPAEDPRFLKKLETSLADPAAILNEREVKYLAGEMNRVLQGIVPPDSLRPTLTEDLVRWSAVKTMCERKRAERGLSTKDAARQLKIPHYRVQAVEKGPVPEFRLECAVRYFRLLGVETWIARWARANGDLGRRLGLA